MKKIISTIISLYFWGLCCPTLMLGQQQAYPGVYPDLPFDLALATEKGYNKTTVWYGTNAKGEGDESGFPWSKEIIISYQYQRFKYFGGKMQIAITYDENGDKLETQEYFYRDNLLSAIEVLSYDTLFQSHFDYSWVYVYYDNRKPFQRVKQHGFPNKRVRLLNEFKFDEQNRVVRQKTTAVGVGPDMDSLTGGLHDKEVRLTTNEYSDTTHLLQTFRDLYKIEEESIDYYNDEGLVAYTEVKNSGGQLIVRIDYEYEGDNCIKKIHHVFNKPTLPESEAEDDDKKKKKKKKPFNLSEIGEIAENVEEAPQDTSTTTAEEPLLLDQPQQKMYKVEYFTYDEDGLIATHIIEEEGIQTVFEYTHFSE